MLSVLKDSEPNQFLDLICSVACFRMPVANSEVAGDAEDVTKGGDVSGTRTTQNADDVERLMSQMKDLSFMLESNLSIPHK
jgi:hypothetical protein